MEFRGSDASVGIRTMAAGCDWTSSGHLSSGPETGISFTYRQQQHHARLATLSCW
jgi:hypothetical protein